MASKTTQEPSAKEARFLLDDRALQKVATYFRLLSEPMRLKILHSLREQERNVGDLCTCTGGSQANISKHLSQLAQAGVVQKSMRGTSAYYRITDPGIYELCDLVCGQIAKRLQDDAALGTLLRETEED